MENGKTVVLVIEPEKSNQGAIERQLIAHGVKVIQSFTLFQGKEFFEANKEILDFIFLDDFSEFLKVDDIISLIKHIKSDDSFKGKLVAISSFQNEEMRKAGCDGVWSKSVLLYMKLKGFIKDDELV
ncbi:MAG: hypothetical protein V4504_00680 [Patescibacteria group bacterium]